MIQQIDLKIADQNKMESDWKYLIKANMKIKIDIGQKLLEDVLFNKQLKSCLR
jgi:hypothetical protein